MKPRYVRSLTLFSPKGRGDEGSLREFHVKTSNEEPAKCRLEVHRETSNGLNNIAQGVLEECGSGICLSFGQEFAPENTGAPLTF